MLRLESSEILHHIGWYSMGTNVSEKTVASIFRAVIRDRVQSSRITPKMKRATASKMWVPTLCQFIRYHISADGGIHQHFCENLKCNI